MVPEPMMHTGSPPTLFLDDCVTRQQRFAQEYPHAMIVATAEEAISMLQLHTFSIVHLDHDCCSLQTKRHPLRVVTGLPIGALDLAPQGNLAGSCAQGGNVHMRGYATSDCRMDNVADSSCAHRGLSRWSLPSV